MTTSRDEINRRIARIERQCRNIAEREARRAREARHGRVHAAVSAADRKRCPTPWPADLPRPVGVTMTPGGRFVAYAKEGWRQVYLGVYDSCEEAVDARKRWSHERNSGRRNSGSGARAARDSAGG